MEVVWNALPVYPRSTSISRGQFRAGLKTYLFNQAYNILWEHFLLRVYCTYLLISWDKVSGSVVTCRLKKTKRQKKNSHRMDQPIAAHVEWHATWFSHHRRLLPHLYHIEDGHSHLYCTHTRFVIIQSINPSISQSINQSNIQ